MVHGWMREDGFMVEQRALRIETHYFATRAKAWVDTHDALLTQRCRQQQLAQVLSKYTDGLLVSL